MADNAPPPQHLLSRMVVLHAHAAWTGARVAVPGAGSLMPFAKDALRQCGYRRLDLAQGRLC
jgi:hypothetical protein